MYKKVIGILLAIALVLPMSACGSKTPPDTKPSDGAPASEEKIKLSYYSHYVKSDDDLRSISFHKRYEEFQKLYPEVELEIITDGHEAWQTKMKTLLAGDEAPDIFTSTPSTLSVYHESGAFYDMSQYLNDNPKFKEGFVTGALNTMQAGDAIYGVPINGYTEGVFYNTEIFRNNGLEFPKTFEELLNCCKALKAKGITPIATGGKDAWPITIITQYLLDRNAGLDYFKKAVSDEAVTLDTPEYRKAFEDFISLVDAGAFSEGALGTSELEARSLFIQGKAAMYLTGSWDVSVFDSAVEDDFNTKVGFENFPVIEGGKGEQGAACVGFGASMCVSSKLEGKKLEYAMKFVEFCTGTEAATKYMEEASAICGSKAEGADMEKVSDLFLQVSEVTNNATQIWSAYGDMITPAFYKEIDTIGQSVLLGGVTAEECSKKLESARIQFQINS